MACPRAKRRSRAQESIQRSTDHRHPQGGGGGDSSRRVVPAARDYTREPVSVEGEIRRDGSQRGAATATAGGGKPAAEARCSRAAAGQASVAGGGHKKVVGPQMQRQAVEVMRSEAVVSERRACGLVKVHRATCRYRRRRVEDPHLRERLRELAATRGRFGYRR